MRAARGEVIDFEATDGDGNTSAPSARGREEPSVADWPCSSPHDEVLWLLATATSRSRAVTVGRTPLIVAAALLAAACTTTTSERVGDFELRRHRQEFAGHSATRTTLMHRGRTVARQVSDWTVDPRRPNRILFAAGGEAAGDPCGTFLYDAEGGETWRVSNRLTIVGIEPDDGTPLSANATPWSPDGRYVFMGNDIARPVVLRLADRHAIDVSDALSADGRRLEMRARAWSADGSKLAVEVAPAGYDGGRDLVAITIDPLTAQYVASMNGPLPLWTTADYHWQDGALIAAATGRNGLIVRKSAGELGWTLTPPVSSEGTVMSECPPNALPR